MSRWQDQFKDHPVHAVIRGLVDHLNTEFEITDNDWFEEKRRLAETVTMLTETIDGLDSEAAPFATLDNLRQDMENYVTPHLASYSSSGGASHLQEANDGMTRLLPDIALLRSLSGSSDRVEQSDLLKKEADEFAASLSKLLTELKGKLNELETRQNNLGGQQTSLEQNIGQTTQQATGLLASIQDQFNQKQDVWDTEPNALYDQKKNEATNELVQIASTTKSSADEHVSQLGELVQSGKVVHEKILELHELVAEDSTAVRYLKDASDERKKADRWRMGSVTFIVATVVWLVVVVFGTQMFSGGTVSWTAYPILASLTGVLLFGAVYAGSQSVLHRRNERQNTWFALRVAAFEPFVSSLEDEQKNELRKELAGAIFSEDSIENGSTEDPLKATQSIVSLVEKLLTAAKR